MIMKLRIMGSRERKMIRKLRIMGVKGNEDDRETEDHGDHGRGR